MNILPQNMKRLMFRLPVYYLIVMFSMSFFQDFFIYHPQKTDPKLIKQAAENRDLRLWPDNVKTYRGFASPGPSQKSLGTILVFHGNAGNARDRYWFLPVKWMLRDRYDNVANLADYRGPVAVVMAGQDEIIPNRLTRRLYDALQQPKRLWKFAEAGHNSWPSGPHESWWGEMMNFLKSTKAGNESRQP